MTQQFPWLKKPSPPGDLPTIARAVKVPPAAEPAPPPQEPVALEEPDAEPDPADGDPCAWIVRAGF